MSREFSNFDHVMLSDGNIFTVIGDNYKDDRLCGIPIFGPSKEGSRTLDGISYKKYPRDGSVKLDAEFYSRGEEHFMSYSFPKSKVTEQVKPREDFENVRKNLKTPHKKLVDDLRAATGHLSTEIVVIGSDTFDLRTDSSDLDLLVIGSDLKSFQNTYEEAIKHRDLKKYPRDGMDSKAEKYAKVFDIPVSVAKDHVGHPVRRTIWRDGEMKVSFIPSQVPGEWNNYYKPDKDADIENIELNGEVSDVASSMHRPRKYRIRTDDGRVLDVISHYFVFCGSFNQGDVVKIKGDLFEQEETVYCRKPGQYISSR
jgi:predicted nucleotidyltransferase